jgi:hypothetical protein
MSSTANDLNALNGLFKEVYADQLENLIPEGVKLMPRVKFVPRAKQPGNFYHAPVILGLEHGVTFAGGDEGAFNLNAPIAGQIKDATVRGNQMVLRSVMPYASAARSVGAGARAFEDATKYLVQNMMRSMARKLEIELFYGQSGYGAVASISGNTITVTTAQWAPGIWAGAENMKVEIRDATGATLRGSAVIQSVDMSARTITLDSAPAGVVATDVIWHFGAYGKEFAGVHKIITNSGSLFGIDASQYSLWKGNVFSASGALSFEELSSALARAVEKGLDSEVVALVNPRTWSNLMTDQAALRRFDSSYKAASAEGGHESLTFHSQNGKIEVVPSIYVKESHAFLLCMDELIRVGSTDITFRRPGQGDEFFKDLENSAGYELRAYTDQALFCSAPGKLVLIDSIVNS